MYRLFKSPSLVYVCGLRYWRHLLHDNAEEFHKYSCTPSYDDDLYCFRRLFTMVSKSTVINSNFFK